MTTSIQELHLIKCSLLPGELLVFAEDAARWNELLESYALDSEPEGTQRAAHFYIKLEASSDLWFDVELSPNGAGRRTHSVSVKGDNLGRIEQARWQALVAEASKTVEGSDYPVYELISTHLFPLLHSSYDPPRDSTAQPAGESSLVQSSHAASPCFHALFVSHHLKSPQKRRSLSQWSHELSLSGFAKIGHPGVIYCEGAQTNVEDFVERVKSMQWLALRLRFIEPVPKDDEPHVGDDDRPPHRWTECDKVGEVVEEMRRLGRESFVMEMGIGSAGSMPINK